MGDKNHRVPRAGFKSKTEAQNKTPVAIPTSTGELIIATHAQSRLAFRSMKTGTLPLTPGFLSEEDKKTIQTQKAEMEKQAAAKSAATMQAKTSARKPGEQGAFASTRHGKARSAPKQIPGAAKLIELIDNTRIDPLPPYDPHIYAKNISNGSSSSSGTSVLTTLSSSSPHHRPGDYHLDEKAQDIIICAGSVYRNLFRSCTQTQLENGERVINKPAKHTPGDILHEIAVLDDDGKKRFWQSNVVQIDVDLRSLSHARENKDVPEASGKDKSKNVAVNTPNVFDQMQRLGQDFFEYTTEVYVNIIFPAPGQGSLDPRSLTHTIKDGKWVYPDHTIAAGSLGFEILGNLVMQLDNLVSLKSLIVVLNNPHASSTVPFTLEQLYYALPFYDLQFTEWKLKWLGNYMAQAVDVGTFPLILLDKERNKWLWEKKKAAQDAKRQKRQIDESWGVIKVTQSEWAPTPPPALYKPVAKPNSKTAVAVTMPGGNGINYVVPAVGQNKPKLGAPKRNFAPEKK